jgi:hypothetical protein
MEPHRSLDVFRMREIERQLTAELDSAKELARFSYFQRRGAEPKTTPIDALQRSQSSSLRVFSRETASTRWG